MKKIILTMFLTVIFCPKIAAQNIVKGVVVDHNSEKPIQGVSILLQTTSLKTDANGSFVLKNLPSGKFIITLKFKGYETQNFSILLVGKTIDLGTILFYEDISVNRDLSTITLTDDELNRSEEHTSELQSHHDLVCRLLLEKKKQK